MSQAATTALEPASEVTVLLKQLGESPDAADRLLPLVYERLRRIARARLRSERQGHTLQATDLVHEAYVRLVSGAPVAWEDRGHFYGVAAEAMRRVLIDHARRRGCAKRGGGREVLPLGELDLGTEEALDEVLAVDEALSRLEAEDERAALIVKLRFHAGLGVEETARALDVSVRTVAREWAYARARLTELLGA